VAAPGRALRSETARPGRGEREAVGDWRGAVEVYGLAASSVHVEAQVALARTLLGGQRPRPPGVGELARASAVIESVALEPGRANQVRPASRR
jgi:hypothetical protein